MKILRKSRAKVRKSSAKVRKSRVSKSRAKVSKSRAKVSKSRAKVSKSRAKVSESRAKVRKSRAKVRKSRLVYRLGSDDEKESDIKTDIETDKESLNILLSCTTLQKRSDLYTNYMSILEPFRYHSLNITILNAFAKPQSSIQDKIVSDIITEDVKELGIDIKSIEMVYTPVYNYLLDNGKLYDYICLIGCNNMNFVFQIWDEEVDQDEEIQMKLVEKLPSLLKKYTRIMFFENNKYQDEFKFHKHLLIESNLSYKLMRKFVTVFKLGYIDIISNRFPYFYHI